jgi:hypothetical protein
LHRDVRLADLHPDGGDLRELEQSGRRDRVSHRLQEVVRRALDNILCDPAEEGPSMNFTISKSLGTHKFLSEHPVPVPASKMNPSSLITHDMSIWHITVESNDLIFLFRKGY